MRVMSIVGTRPEMIKMSEIIKKLDRFTEHIFIHTGQNYDYELSEIFYKDLGLRRPDHILDVAGDSLGETLGSVMFEAEKMLQLYEPDAVVILGDTNSALAGIIAKRRKIPLFHLEAGNRCFDDNVPEEINRRILDHIADVNMVYTQGQRLYLRDEGISKDRIFVMGSPMKEVLSRHRNQISDCRVLSDLELEPQQYFLVSIHRDENVEIDDNLEELIITLAQIRRKYKLPIIVSTHPRLKNKLVDADVTDVEGIEFMPPFGFIDYIKLQLNAKCVISDSGTIAEESSILGFPAITIRNAIERAEAIDTGSILMTGVDSTNIMDCLRIVQPPTTIPVDYDVDNCSERVLKVILGYTDYVNRYVWRKR